MSDGKDKSSEWQFSLRKMFGVVTLVGIEVWLMQQGPAWYFFVPLFVTIAIELSGNHAAALISAYVMLLLWICFPCIYAFLAS